MIKTKCEAREVTREVNKTRVLPNHQKGAALLVAMIMLLILTMLGIGTMETSSVQLKMTESMRSMSSAFNLVENAIVSAERQVEAIVSAGTVEVFGGDYYDNRLGDAALPTLNEGDVIIEYLGRPPCPGYADPCADLFRITARDSAGSGAGRTIQSLYSVEI